jgi:hypothetical protein
VLGVAVCCILIVYSLTNKIHVCLAIFLLFKYQMCHTCAGYFVPLICPVPYGSWGQERAYMCYYTILGVMVSHSSSGIKSVDASSLVTSNYLCPIHLPGLLKNNQLYEFGCITKFPAKSLNFCSCFKVTHFVIIHLIHIRAKNIWKIISEKLLSLQNCEVARPFIVVHSLCEKS